MDLFCGTGGFSKGFEQTGNYRTVFGIDLLPIAIETFKANHPGALAVSGDIRRFSPEWVESKLPESDKLIDVIIGGPPCQGFSSIRPNRSSQKEDQRNHLFLDFLRFVEHFRPKAFVMENVVGLATFKEGSTLSDITAEFEKIGYRSDWRILNAAHFGVPQKRERLILIGTNVHTDIRFPVPTHFYVGSTIGHKAKSRMLQPDLFSMLEADLSPAVSTMDAIGDLPAIGSGQQANQYDQEPITPYQSARRQSANQYLTLHKATTHSEKMLEIIRHSGENISSIPSHLISSGFSSCYSRLSADEPAVTITVNFVHPASNRCIHPVLDRALTPREGARLQSFDDDFVFNGTRTQITKQIGNAVPPLLGKAVALAVSQMIETSGTASEEPTTLDQELSRAETPQAG